MWAEYKAFLLRGNLVELATAFLLGVAFSAVVSSLAEDVLMQLIAALVGEPDFSGVVVTVRGTPIGVGAFLTALVNFLIVASALFLVVRATNRFRGEAAEESSEVSDEVLLLGEIRDELRGRR
jgi:large conductance mechanosensitive channel